MAFVVPSGSFDGGSPALGALTGLSEGLFKGIQAGQQNAIAQRHAAVAEQEQALRQAAYAHGLTNEADQKAWIQRFGEFKAWDAAGGGAQPLQGPPTPGAMQAAPGGMGPPQQGESQPLGMGGPNGAIKQQKIMDLARSAPNEQTAKAFLDAVHQDEMEGAIQAHGKRVSTDLRNHAALGSFTKRLAGGVEDPSGNDIHSQLADQIDQFLASPEAKSPEAAQFIDHIEQEKQATLAQTAESNTTQHLRQLQSERMLKQIQEKWASGTSMADLADAVAYYHTYSTGVDATPKDLGTVEKEFNDAISGNGQIKREAAQHKWENEQLRAQNQALWNQMRGAAIDTPADKMQRTEARGVTAKDIAAMRLQGAAGLEDKRTARVGSELENLTMRNALVAAQSDKDWRNADTDEKKATIVDRYVTLQQRKNGSLVLPAGSPTTPAPSTGKLGGPGTGVGGSAGSSVGANDAAGGQQVNILNQLRMRAKAEGWDRARTIKEFEKVGLDPNAPAPK